MAKLELDICTPEGKTWLARVVGLDKKFGLNREFVKSVGRVTSKSGKTGTATYVVGPGLYEANEGRKSRGRTYYLVIDDEVREIEREIAYTMAGELQKV